MASRINMRLEYERCRTYGHAWDEFLPLGKRRAGWGSRLSLRCVRCMTERHDTVDALGELSVREYVYPDDYRLGADETPTRAAMRLDLLKRNRAQARDRARRAS